MSDGVGNLIALADALNRGQLPAEPVRRYLIEGVRSLLDGEDIARAFGITPSASSYSIRDEALRQAAALVDGDPARLAREVRRFQARTWPRWKDRQAPAPGACELDTCLFRAFKCQRRMPTSERQLFRIMNGIRDGSVRDHARE